MFENARTHGKCKNIHTCGQFYPTRKKLHITIVDTGKTIVNNVNDFLNKGMSSSECINWAMETGNTTKVGNTPGGLGLGLIFEFINLKTLSPAGETYTSQLQAEFVTTGIMSKQTLYNCLNRLEKDERIQKSGRGVYKSL